MKNLNLLSGFIGLALVASSVEIAPRENQPIAIGFANAFAGDGTSACDALVASAQAAVPPNGKYASPALGLFHSELYRFNRLETSDVELVFCRLTKVLGFDPNLAQLPQTVERSDPKGNHKVTVTVSAPTESFATTNGYVAKAVVKWDNAPFLTLWWSGSATTSKGYLILGDNPMVIDGMTRLRYVQWDRSVAQQGVKFLGTQYASTFLTNPTGSAGTQSGGDRITYGRASYNTSTKAVMGQAVQIRAVLPSATFGCIKSAFHGTLDGSMDVFRNAGGTPEAITDTNKDGTRMDGITGIIDSVSTTGGTPVAVPATLPEPLDYACADLDGADASGKAFAGGNVNYDADPSSIFPH